MTIDQIYLDHNATSPPLPEVVELVARTQHEVFGNPGSRHRFGRRARQVLEDAREQIAARLGAEPDELLFTSGGTESNNLALIGLTGGPTQTLLRTGPGMQESRLPAGPSSPRRIVHLTPGSHPSMLEPVKTLESVGWTLHDFPLTRDGQLVGQALDQIDQHSALVGALYAHNETGVILDVNALAERCQEAGVPWHLDAVQAVGRVPVHFRELGSSTLAFGAHKFHGPRGIGGLLVRRGTRLTPLLAGGRQEEERRAGTEPVALAAGMALALELALQDSEHTARVARLRDQLQAALLTEAAPAIVIAAGTVRLPNTLNVAFPDCDGEALLVALDLAGVACSLGTTCASGSAEPAPVLLAMGYDADVAKTAVRFSLGLTTTDADITTAIERIVAVIRQVRRARG